MNAENVLFAPGENVTVGISPRGFPMLAYEPHPDYGAAPGLWLGLEFSVEQARGIAKELLRKADFVEAEMLRRQDQKSNS